MGKGSSGCMLAATKTCRESSNTLREKESSISRVMYSHLRATIVILMTFYTPPPTDVTVNA